MRSIRVLSFTLLLAAATISARAEAQAPATSIDAASARADELAHQGNDLALKHSWAEAEALFRQAWTLKQSYDIGGNLGIAELNLEKYCDAAEHLSFALKRFPANGKPDHRELLHDKLENAKAHVGALAITVSTPGAEVFVDGKRRGLAPLADVVFLEPGSRKIEARLSGYDTAMQTVDAAKGGSSATSLTLKESAPVPPPLTPGSGRKTGLLVVGGVGVASLVTAIVFTVVSGGKRSDAEEIRGKLLLQRRYCNPAAGAFATQCEALQSASSSHDTFHNLAVGGYVLAGGAAAATVAMLLMSGSGTPKKTSSVQVGPLVSSTGGGAFVGGSF
jgi:hypothetical protein